jgi:hypothetical protein
MASRFDAHINQGINQLADPSRVQVTFAAFYIRRGSLTRFPDVYQKTPSGERPQTLAQQGTAMPPKLFAAPRAVYERSHADNAVLVRHHAQNARRMRSRKDSEARERDPRGGVFHFDGPRCRKKRKIPRERTASSMIPTIRDLPSR